MAVSKRLRFEILRRDNHTCYYCGRKPPEVELTVDHVLPQALGGTDEATNLVAACRDCNGGKTSVAPDSQLVAQVDQDAIRWSAAMRVAIAKAEADQRGADDYRQEFLATWRGFQHPAPLDDGWRLSVENFRSRGLPIASLIDAADRAMSRTKVASSAKFKYMCGIAWKKIEEIEAVARKHLATASPASTLVEDEWIDPTQAPVVDAAVAVWISRWQERYAEDPIEGLADEVRDQAMTLYPEYIGPDELIQTVIRAGWQKSADLGEWAMDCSPESRVQQVAAWFFYGWVAHNSESAAPMPDHWNELASSALYAFDLGYSDEAVAEAAFRAGCSGNRSVEPWLLTFATGFRDEEQGDFAGMHADRDQIEAWMDLGREQTARFASGRRKNESDSPQWQSEQ